MVLRDRGVYRQDRTDGVHYFVHDHNRVCIVHSRVHYAYACDSTEDAFRCWLATEDPVAPSDAVDPAAYMELRLLA
jgi:hypothetical protein